MNGIIKHFIAIGFLSLSSCAFASGCPDILQGKQRLLNSSEEIDLCESFKGKTLLVVNTASQCGFTPQFEQLEALYQTYKDKNFTVVGFPSNDFKQDKGTEENSAKICYLDYGVTFPMMARSSVTGASANPVFSEISQQAGVSPRWNFYKFLIDKEGNVIATFPSSTSPTSTTLTDMIEQHL
ncbi:Belongs to the glutathione peroxidase family [Vibrio sp. B1FLJ16]|uniref:glutathione peroxidase n=1 Tax=Vibrio sp. B1FLJ16 TaxID=2751178 RepID=UPI0015F3C157|nr:glutathione peroxidase [Vibrio sp. B1FLJ16]CAD7822934.1 Belongs to the glutathione peroxidase family [Vibrio sp. B1FLJ16]CAE6950466.1 Belongs to the glutathione peroxidase family [Vibrio sp. B1FLJ16]